MLNSFRSKVNAVLTGASAIKRSLKLPIGWTQTDDGKEKELVLSIPITGKASTVQEAIDCLASLPYDGSEKSLVRVGLPKTSKKGETRLVISPRMIPQRLACLVAFLAGYNMPKNIDEKDAAAHLSACGIDVDDNGADKSERETVLNEALASK